MNDGVLYHSVEEWVDARVGSTQEAQQEFAELLAAQGMTEIQIENGTVVFRDPSEDE